MKRFLLVALVFSWFGCSPGYESGKTKCSEKGECPSGFICSDNGSGSANTCITRPSFCPDGDAFYCPMSGTCWLSSVACSTVFNCGTNTSPDYRACVAVGYHPDCSGTTCLPGTGGVGGSGDGGLTGSGGATGTGTSPDAGALSCTNPAYPVYCDSDGTIPAGCWAPGTVCSTITNCGTSAAPSYAACVTAGYYPDCNGTTCLPGTGGVGGHGDGGPAATGGATGTGGSGHSDGGPASTGGAAGGATGTGTSPDAGVLSCTNPAYPAYCDSVGTVPAGCWSAGTVCSTITNCGTSAAPNYAACVTAGYHPDCSGTTCLPDSSGTDGGTGRGDGGTDAGVPDANSPDGQVCPPPAAGGTCNVLPSCGCPAGQICYPDTPATGLTCETTAGLGEGAACNGKGCAEGLGCFGGVCKPYCQSDSDCPAVDSARSCEPTYWDSDNTIAGVSVCARVCDPVSPQNPRGPLLACPAGFGCTAAGTSLPGASNCESQSGTGVTGSACSTDDDCTPGYYCSVGNTCIKYCYTVADCPTGMTCISFSTPSYAGTVQVNHCHSP